MPLMADLLLISGFGVRVPDGAPHLPAAMQHRPSSPALRRPLSIEARGRGESEDLWRRSGRPARGRSPAVQPSPPLTSGTLREINPEIALDPAPSGFRDTLRIRDLDFRLYRRIIEIRDGRLALRPFLDADVARRAREDALRNG
jgi:hypothetical protein